MTPENKKNMIQEGLRGINSLYGEGFFEALQKQGNFAEVVLAFEQSLGDSVFSIIETYEQELEKYKQEDGVKISKPKYHELEIWRKGITTIIAKCHSKPYNNNSTHQEYQVYGDNIVHIEVKKDNYVLKVFGELTKSGKSLNISFIEKKGKEEKNLEIKNIFAKYLIDLTVKSLLNESELCRSMAKVIVKSGKRALEEIHSMPSKTTARVFDNRFLDFAEMDILFEDANKEIADYKKMIKKIERREKKAGEK